MAYDTIMVFPDQFKKHILADQIHILNVSFMVPDMRREFGGTAGNIAYNLKLLGEDPRIMATVGHDFGPYAARLEELRLSTRNVKRLEGQFTAQAFITTDVDDNQITAFHPGAMMSAHLNRVADAPEAKLGIVSPDGRDGMIEHARDFAAARIPYVFDPGQGLPMFTGEDLMRLIAPARALTVNDYEARVVEQKTGRTIDAIARMIDAVVVTRGGEGSSVFTRGARIDVPCVKPEAVVDPTGLPRGVAVRHGARLDVGEVRAARLAHGLDQDRPSRRAESPSRA
jgi:adenosine kinase